MRSNSGDFAISVVMPAFNAEKTIAQAIQSVLDQTYTILELIVVNDASSDNTLQIAQQFAREDVRVHVITNETNLGVSGSRNRGIALSHGDWIAFLDSDDMWQPDKIEKQCVALSNDESSVLCFTGSSFIDERGIPYGYTLKVPEQICYQELLKQNLISCSSVLAKKNVLERYPMIRDPMIHEDYVTWLRILRTIPYATGVNEPLLIYRIGRHSKSGNKIRAAKMQWRTYATAGVGKMTAVRYFAVYACRNLRKYLRIHNSMNRAI